MPSSDSIKNILLRVAGDTDDGERALASIRTRLAEFGGVEATAEAVVEVNDRGLGATIAALTAFNAIHAEAEAEVRMEQGTLAQLAAATAELATFSQFDVEADARVNVRGALTGVAAIRAALEGITDAEVEVNIDQASYSLALAAIRHIGTLDPVVDVKLDLTDLDKAAATLAALKGAGSISDLNIEGRADINTSNAHAKLAALSAAIQVVDGDDIEVDVHVDRNGLARRALDGIKGAFSNMGSSAGGLDSALKKITINLGPFGLKLGLVVVQMLAAAAAMGVSLVAAALAMAIALAGAAIAVGALAAAFVAALGPAVALAVAVVSKFVQVLKVVKGLEDSSAAAARKSAEGSKAASAAAEQRKERLIAVATALRGLASAERGVQEAQKGAADAITDANRTQADAAESLGQANTNLQKTSVDAYRAIADAAEEASDALLGLESAKLGIDEAALSTKEAQLRLKEFRKETGTATASLDGMFKKFTDVDFQGKVDLGGALPGQDGGKELELERLILAVKRAKIGEKQATDTLSDAERRLKDARSEQLKFAREGISAYEPFTAAVRTQREATQNLADATRKATELQTQGIAGAPAVISAQEALISAQQRLTEARREVTAQTTGADGIADDAAKARQDFEALSPALQRFVGTIMAVKGQLKGFFEPAVDSVFDGMARATASLPALLQPLRRSFTNFAAAVGKILGDAGGKLASPRTIKAFEKLIDGAAQLTVIFGNKVFPALFDLFLSLATTALPKLVELTDRFGNFLLGLAAKSEGSGLKAFMATVFSLLGSVAGLAKEVLGIFAALFTGGQEQSGGFLDTLTRGAAAFRQFLQSAEGQAAIRSFFNDLLPLAKATIGFIIRLIVGVVNIIRVIAPALTGTLRVFNILLDVFNFLMAKFRKVLQIAALVATFFLPGGGFFKAFLAAARKVGAFITIIGSIPGKFGELIRALPGVLGKIIEVVTYPFRKIVDFVRHDLFPFFGRIGKKLIDLIVKGIKNAPGSLVKAVKDKLGPIARLLPGSEPKDKSSPLRGLGKRGAAILDNMARGVAPGGTRLAAAVSNSINPVVSGLSMNVPVPSVTTTAPGGFNIENVNLPPAPEAAIPDARYQAQQFMNELTRRGGG